MAKEKEPNKISFVKSKKTEKPQQDEPEKKDGRGGYREGSGRPETELTAEQWGIVKGVCHVLGTQEEAAHAIGIHRETLQKCITEVHGMTWEQFYSVHKTVGTLSLRRAQYKMAVGQDANKDTGAVEIAPNPTMAIWLGKQHLDQKDKHEIGFDPNQPAVFKLKMGKDLSTPKSKE